MKRVLDASAFLTGRPFSGDLFTVPEVLPEVRRHGLTPPLEALLDNQVTILAPSSEARTRVAAAARSTGDAPRLSPTDVALLALALDLGAILVTDDYSIQNVAHSLSLQYEGVLEPGIREQWTWTYRCSGCGKKWTEWRKDCPTCGAPLRTARPRRQPR